MREIDNRFLGVGQSVLKITPLPADALSLGPDAPPPGPLLRHDHSERGGDAARGAQNLHSPCRVKCTMLPWMLSNYVRTPSPTHPSTAPIPAEVQQLQQEVQSLELACAGMWELLKFKLGCTDEELVAAVQAVDGRDGQVDGKIRKTPGNCPSCGRRVLMRKSNKCAWCGASAGKSPL